ncbi:MAG: LamG-like jellyroll fold domain-containing protein, partial [Candidatus Entotheonellia bacterium]
MVRFEHDGMSIWYGTADAPAPVGNVSAAEEVIVSVGVMPVDASNSVEICYRVNQGPVQTVPAKWHRNELASRTQYFRAYLPPMRAGDVVEYTAVCRCAGRQVPSAEQAKRLEGSFRVVDETAESAREEQRRITPQPDLSEARVTPEVRRGAVSPALEASPLAFRSQGLGRTLADDAAASPRRGLPQIESSSPRIERPNPAPRVPTKTGMEIPNPTLNELASKIRLERGQEVLSILGKHGINTLKDVRTTGGIHQLEGLGVDPDHPAVKVLEAHANLSVLSPDLEVNAKLIEKDYTSVGAIAETPQPVFVDATRTELGEGRARWLYGQARQQFAVLEHMRASMCMESANGFKAYRLYDKFREETCKPPCACEDCDTAVSPRAYLADLLVYTLKHVTRPGDRGGTVFLTLDDMEQAFHQPFRRLPGSCAAATEKVRQVRLCIEVLRRHLGTRDANAEVPYRLAAYTTLLRKLGTSYQELRLARTAGDEARKQLADRLLVVPDQLDQLRIEPASLTEEILETRFGLPSTVHTEPPLKQPETFELQAWRLEALRAQWKEQDWPADAPGPVSEVNGVGYMNPNPIMDQWPGGQSLPTGYQAEGLSVTRRSAGTYLGLSAYAAEVMAASDQTEGYLYQEISLPEALRGGTVKFSIAARAVPNNLAAGGAPAYQGVLAFDGSDDYIEVADTRSLNLSDEATFEAWIYPTGTGSHQPAGGMIVSQDGVFAIARFRDGTIRWAFEHDTSGWRWVNTGYVAPASQWTHFAIVYDARAGTVRSYVDGTLVHTETARGALKRTNAALFIGGAPSSRQHFEGRLGEVRIWNMARTEREIHRDRQQILGSSEPGLVAYWRFDDEPDGDEMQDWTGRSRGLLGGGIEASKPMWIDTTTPVRLEVWQGAAGTAQTGLIERSFTPSDSWTRYTTAHVSLDRDADTVQLRVYVEKPVLLGGFFLETTRRETFKPPIVDPDVITKQHLRNLADGDPAYDLWQGRHDWIAGRLDDFRNQAGNPQARLDAMVQTALQVLPQTLEVLAAQQNKGNDISESLELLGLPRPAFNYLHSMRTLVAEGNDLLQDEWKAVYSILVQVEKRRQFPIWRQDEKGSVFLSPDFFKIPEPYPIQFPPVEPEPPPTWRATWGNRRDWEDALQARIDQGKSLRESLREAVRETEEEVLPMLRDLLIQADAPSGVSREEHAKTLAELLLIDTRMDGCQMTTRVSQAIETLQGLLWSLRTGQIAALYREWNFSVPAQAHFDGDWQWLGSYATWRAAMFVYLYPENILHPTLRPWQSQGFQELAQQLRLNPRLNPESAQQLADRYAEYYRDLTQLEVEATCQAGTHTYFYGRAPSGACYWSRYDHDDDDRSYDPDYAHSSWRRIQSLSGKARTVTILAAVPFAGTEEQLSSVLVFAKQRKDGKYQLVIAKQDLNNDGWGDEELEPLPLPSETEDFSAVISQIRTVHERPGAVIKTVSRNQRHLYNKLLDGSGDQWEDDEWTDLFGLLDPLCPLEIENVDASEAKNLDLKALIPIYYDQAPTCYSLLLYHCRSENGLRYLILRTSPPLRELEIELKQPGTYESGLLNEGQLVYTDRDETEDRPAYTWKEIHPDLRGSTYIMTANNDKHSVGFPFLQFEVNQPVIVYVAYDPRLWIWAWALRPVLPIPFWLFEWQADPSKELSAVDTDQEERTILYKDYPEGPISLGGNIPIPRDDNFGFMYSVIIVPRTGEACDVPGVTSEEKKSFPFETGNGWVGAFARKAANDTVVVYKPAQGRNRLGEHLYGSSQLKRLAPDLGITSPSPIDVPSPGFNALAVDSGILVDERLCLAHIHPSHPSVWSAGLYRTNASSDLERDGPYWQVLPLDNNPLPLKAANHWTAQQDRRAHTRTVFEKNQDDRMLTVPPTTRAYIAEYYYYVPLLLALELQRRGYYQEALDWYRTVYDYAEQDEVGGETSRRKIWY